MAGIKKLKANNYVILQECVEQGIETGWNKAHKHTSKPTVNHIKEQIDYYIMLNISEKFKFD